MSFNGSLFTIGGANFPLKYIKAESYTCQREIMDLDSTRDTSGLLQRNVLDHESAVITFQVKDGMWNDEHAEMWSFINSHLSSAKARKARITYYIPELDSYDTGDFYIPTPTPVIYYVDTKNNRIMYRSYEIQFIRY